MSSKKEQHQSSLINESDILPTITAKSRFVRELSGIIANFLRNGHNFSMSRMIELERRDVDVLQVFTAMESLLNTSATKSVDQRVELLSLVCNYVDRKRTSQAGKVSKDFASQAIMHLFDSLTSVSVDSTQEQARKVAILGASSSISADDWKQAVMAVAIRRPKLTNADVPLEFKTNFVFDDGMETSFQRVMHTSHGPKVGLYSFIMEVIKEWIQSSKDNCSVIKSRSSSSADRRHGYADTNSVNHAQQVSMTPSFVEIMTHNISRKGVLESGLKVSISTVLTRYADQYVGLAPSAVSTIVDKEKQWLLKAGKIRDGRSKSSTTRQLSREAEIALTYGLPATSLIKLAADEGYYYGYSRQLTMFKTYETSMKDVSLRKTFDSFADRLGRENMGMYSSLLTEVGRMVGAAGGGQPTAAPNLAPQPGAMAPQTIPVYNNYGGITTTGQMLPPPNSTPTTQPASTQLPYWHGPNQYSGNPNTNSANPRNNMLPASIMTGHYPQQQHQQPPVAQQNHIGTLLPPPITSQLTAPKHVSFASSYLSDMKKPSSSSGYTSPPAPGTSNSSNTRGILRQPFGKYEDSSDDDSSSGVSDSDSSASDTDNSGSDADSD